MDVASVSNISVLIMDSYFHGYYIHGEAPWVSSDIVMSELKKKLDGEREGTGLKRGVTELHPTH